MTQYYNADTNLFYFFDFINEVKKIIVTSTLNKE